MSVTLSEIATAVRGICIDRIVDGEEPLFSETDLVSAANIVKDDFYGKRPEAFCDASIAVQNPSDMSSTRGALLFTNEGTSITLRYLEDAVGASQLESGKVQIDFRTSAAGAIMYFGDSLLEYFDLRIDAAGIDLEIEDTTSGQSVSATLAGDFMDDRWHTLSVEADGANVVITCDAETQSEAYTGALLPSLANGYIGYSPAGGVEDYFAGAMSALIIYDEVDTELMNLLMDDGSGYSVEESINGYDADIFGPTITWLSDDTLPMAPWAFMTYCYGVAAFLLNQRGKDKYFRTAADDLTRLYNGRMPKEGTRKVSE